MLPKAFVDERFAFYGKALSGTPQQRERWKRGVDATNDALGDAVGQAVRRQRTSRPRPRRSCRRWSTNIVAAFDKRIDALTWMTPKTKANAKAKLATLMVGVGYPDTWRDYSTLEVVRGDALGNAERAELFDYERQLAKLGRPVDRSEWWMTPQTVNAVNLPLQNALNFPAAILQPPFFDPRGRRRRRTTARSARSSATRSATASTIRAASSTRSGKLANWWTPEDLAHFKRRPATAGRAVQRVPAASRILHVNGQQTLSENIADVAGLSAAYDAYRVARRRKRRPVATASPAIRDSSSASARCWRSKMREALLRPDRDHRRPRARRVPRRHGAQSRRAGTRRSTSSRGRKLYLAPADRVRVW